MMRRVVLSLLFASPAWAQPAIPDLAAMIECRVDARTYNGFALEFAMDPDAATDLGWIEVEQPNPFLREFSLTEPVRVFGRETRNIGFGASGLLAFLNGEDARKLAAELGVVAVVDTPEKFLGEKVLSEIAEEQDGLRTRTRIALNVSTVDSHPGKVLAGCSYAVTVE